MSRKQRKGSLGHYDVLAASCVMERIKAEPEAAGKCCMVTSEDLCAQIVWTQNFIFNVTWDASHTFTLDVMTVHILGSVMFAVIANLKLKLKLRVMKSQALALMV
jgi:hypothetical protein